MSYSKLVCESNKNLQRVFTRKSDKTLSGNDLKSAVEIVKKSTKKKDDKIILTLEFKDGNKVRVTYENL